MTIIAPEELKTPAIARDVKGGRYDLIIFDGVKPEAAPEANALYFGVFPVGPAYEKPKDVMQPVVLDWDIGHPLMQYVRDLSLIFILRERRASTYGDFSSMRRPKGVTILSMTVRS